VTGVVTDTHALVFHLVEPGKLGKSARRAFAAADSGKLLCHVPVIVLAEVALLSERGRIRVSLQQVLASLAAHPGYEVLPLDAEQCLEFSALIGIRDPMDRLVAAASRVVHARLISSDTVFDAHLDRIWD
jgi:PIN domain nuclease of toxin-antitoxin system